MNTGPDDSPRGMVVPSSPPEGRSPPNTRDARAEARAPAAVRRSVRFQLLLPLAGLLTAMGGVALLAIGPGYRGPGIEVVSVPAGVLVVGGLALVVETFWRPRRRGASDRLWSPRAAPAFVVLGGAVFVVAMLLSVGSVPGLYLRDHGSVTVPLTGCSGGRAYAPSGVPDGFPPGARVDVTWATENDRYAEFELQQESVNSLAPGPSNIERGTSGDLRLTGAGGPIAILAISNGTTYACAAPALTLVSWTYSTVV